MLRLLIGVTKWASVRGGPVLGRRCWDMRYESKASASNMKKLIEGLPKQKINERDGKGWTALMLAAKEGDADAVQMLLDKGADISLRTGSGHSAYDIAIFWRHENCTKILKPLLELPPLDNFFAFSNIERNAHKRKNSEWIHRAVMDDQSEFVLMHHARPLVAFDSSMSPKTKLQTASTLFIRPYADVHHLIKESFENVIYLGKRIQDVSERKKGEKITESNVFAIDISDVSEKDIKELYPGVEVISVLPGLLKLRPIDAGIAAQARSLLDWHDKYRYCPCCGSQTKMVNAGYKRICTNKSCITKKEGDKGNTLFPRVDPTVICNLVSRDNRYSLLARQKGFPGGMYSCLAGFVEPGESIEQACKREVFEEVGLDVRNVKYHSSQPWPMPSSLMLGCMAYTEHNPHIEVNRDEIEDAQWFSREDVVLMLMQLHPERLFLPPRQAIANRLLTDWLVKTAFDDTTV